MPRPLAASSLDMYRIILLLLIVFFSCDQKVETTRLTGDLYFGFFRIGSYYNQPDSLIEKYEKYFLTTNLDTLPREEKVLFDQYNKLKKHDLLYSPFVQVLVERDSIIMLYLNLEDYNKIKIYKRQKLQDENKKVQIFAFVEKIDNKLYYCKNLDKVLVVDGQTFQVQKKFLIEDYN